MKTKVKMIAIIAILVMLTLVLPSGLVNAALTAKVVVEPDKTLLKPSDTLTLVIKLDNVADAGTGISDMLGTITYDTNFFEKDIQVEGGSWMMNEETNLFSLSSNNMITKSGEVFATIKLKVKSTAEGNTTIKFTDLEVSSGDLATCGDVVVNVGIGEEASPTVPPTTAPTTRPTTAPTTKPTTAPTPNNNNPNSNGGGSSGGSSGGSNSGSTNGGYTSQSATIDKTQSPSILPKTGLGVLVLVVTVGAAVVGAIFYVKYRKYKKI